MDAPIQTTKFFTSSSNHQQRRSAPYRSAPKAFSPKVHKPDNIPGDAAGVTGGRRWLSPNNSNDSSDGTPPSASSLSSPSRGGGASGSVHTAATAVINNTTRQKRSNNNRHNRQESHPQEMHGFHLKTTTSFDDCYVSVSPGYHDAFTLLEGVERAKVKAAVVSTIGSESKNSIISSSNNTVGVGTAETDSKFATATTTTPSPRSKVRMPFFPSSPRRSTSNIRNHTEATTKQRQSQQHEQHSNPFKGEASLHTSSSPKQAQHLLQAPLLVSSPLKRDASDAMPLRGNTGNCHSHNASRSQQPHPLVMVTQPPASAAAVDKGSGHSSQNYLKIQKPHPLFTQRPATLDDDEVSFPTQAVGDLGTPPRAIAIETGAPALLSGKKLEASAVPAAMVKATSPLAAKLNYQAEARAASASSRHAAVQRVVSPSLVPPAMLPKDVAQSPTAVAMHNRNMTSSPLRHSSPLNPSRISHTLRRTWNRTKKSSKVQLAKGGGGDHARTRTRSEGGGSGNYSDAVSQALCDDGMAPGDASDIFMVGYRRGTAAARPGGREGSGSRPPKSGGEKSTGITLSQDGTEVVAAATGAADPEHATKGGFYKLRNRSRSPLRVGNRHCRLSKMEHDGNGKIDNNDGCSPGLATDHNSSSSQNNLNSIASTSLHIDKDSTTSTPVLVTATAKSMGIRNMSPSRMKRSWKKKLAIPSSPRQSYQNNPWLHNQQQLKLQQSQQLKQKQLQPSLTQQALQSSSLEKHLLPPHAALSDSGGKKEGSFEEEKEEDGDCSVISLSLAQTTMSFDVDDAVPTKHQQDQRDGTSSLAAENMTPLLPIIQPVLENNQEDVERERFHVNTRFFSLFESKEFLSAFGGKASEANLAASYIRRGDEICANKEATRDEPTDSCVQGEGEKCTRLEQAVQVYYAGLGKVLTRIGEWASERRGGHDTVELLDTNGSYISSSQFDPDGGMNHVSYKDLAETARCPKTNILLLAMSSVLLRAANTLFHIGRWEEACRDYAAAQAYRVLRLEEAKDAATEEQSVEYGEAILREDNQLKGRISNNAAAAQVKQGMYDEARSEYTMALQIKQGTLEGFQNRPVAAQGALSPSRGGTEGKREAHDDRLVSDVASTFYNIGLLRIESCEPKKAEKAYKQSLSLRVNKFGLDDLGVSSTLRALGDLYYQGHKYEDAFRSYKESLRIWKRHSGRSDLTTAEYYYNIGLVFYAKGPYAKARTSVLECLRIRRLLCSPSERLPVATALYLLGLIVLDLGNYDEALSLLEESLAIRRELLTSHDNLLLPNVQLAIGMVHNKRNELDTAMDCFSNALAGRKLRLGKHGVAEVLQAIGDTYTSAQDYDKAHKTLEETLRLRRAAASSVAVTLGLAETLDSLSLIHFRLGDTEKALELGEQARNMLRSAAMCNHHLAGKVLKNTGDYYQSLDAYDAAMKAYLESLQVMTLWYGQEHVFLSEVLNEIGVTRFKSGEFILAKQSFREALRLMRLTHNEINQSAIFPTLNHLGHALYKNEEFQLAAATYTESFNIQAGIVTGSANSSLKEFSTKLNAIKDRIAMMKHNEECVRNFSESLGGIASILRYLGLVIQEQGDFDAALSANKLSFSVRLCQPFREHAAIALVAETIAMSEFKRSNLQSAMDYFEQALKAKKMYQGESTIDVARTVNNLANIHFSLGNYEDAMELYQQALGIKRHCLGDKSMEVANTLNNVAHVMVKLGKEQKALSAYHNVVKIRQNRHGKSHISVAATLASIGDVYIKLGKLEIAMTYFEQCIRIQQIRQDRCDERILENLGSIYGKLGEWNKAMLTFKSIIDLKKEAHGDQCLDVAKTLDLLAVSFIEQDRYVESIEHLQEALRIRKVCLGDEDGEILASLNKLAFVYKSLDMTEQMVEMKKEFDTRQAFSRSIRNGPLG